MSASQESCEWTLKRQLLAVAEAAGARLRAETDQDVDAANVAADELTRAATSAMAAGCSLTEIARAEARGKDTLRSTLRADALKHVERTGGRARDAQAQHYLAIARATRLALPMREIAHAAHVTHSTIRAITNRLAAQASTSEPADKSPQRYEGSPPSDQVEQWPPRQMEDPWPEPVDKWSSGQ